MVQRYYVCLSPHCESEDGGQKAFVRLDKAEEHRKITGHGFREVNKHKRVSRLYHKGKGKFGMFGA